MAVGVIAVVVVKTAVSLLLINSCLLVVLVVGR